MVVDKKIDNKNSQVLSEIIKQISDKTYPPVHLWNPEYCGDIDIRIDKQGVWYYMSSAIDRHEMVRLFSTVLRRDGDDYFLVTPVEKLGINVDDVPFQVVRMEVFGTGKDQTLSFETLSDDKIVAGTDNPIRVDIDGKTGEPSPYLAIRGGMDGRISRSIYYELINLAQEKEGDNNTLGVWSGGEFFTLGQVESEK